MGLSALLAVFTYRYGSEVQEATTLYVPFFKSARPALSPVPRRRVLGLLGVAALLLACATTAAACRFFLEADRLRKDLATAER